MKLALVDPKRRLYGFVQGDNGLRAQFIRGGLGSGGIMAANRILTLALGIVLARMLGAMNYGIYAYALAIMSFLLLAAEAGVPTLLTREIATRHGHRQWGLLRGVVGGAGQSVGLVALSVSLVGLLVLWQQADALSSRELWTYGLMLMVVPVLALGKTVTHALLGLGRVVAGQAANLLMQPLLVLLFVGVTFLVWPGSSKPHYVMASQLLAALIVLLVSGLVLRYLIPREVLHHQPKYKRRAWLKRALPFTLIAGAGLINTQADIIMLGWYRTPEEVGVYSVAARGGVLVTFVIQAASAVLLPHFARLYATNQVAHLSALFKSSTLVILLGTLPIVFVFVSFGGPVIEWVFGGQYRSAATPLAILAVGYGINVMFGPVGALLQMTGNESVTARVLWIAAALNVVMNSILIPLYGSAGAATATAISVALYHAQLRYVTWMRLGF